MIRQVAAHLPEWRYGWVKKIIFHIETVSSVADTLRQIRRLKVKAGIAVNPGTDASRVYPYLDEVDTILVMTVNPGRSGARFQPAVIEKVRQLRFRNKLVNIEVDGGINPATSRECLKAGANLFVIGSYLKDSLFARRLRELKDSLRQ